MAKINFDFYTGTDTYNDGDVEQKLLEHYKSGKEIDYDADDIFFLTTHIRTNILNWYPFFKTDKVLEIGPGCGTLTATLCEKCESVCSVEGSKRRAEITYQRNMQYENLEVYAAEFGKFKINQKFDYVILIGVFEYAKRFFNEKEPFNFFLAEIKKVLKPEGKVLIAIENRYGMKYWAGANEDHLSKPYVGFNDYDLYDVQTFGKKEFENMVKAMGFSKCKFYYPFPDYKLPEIIYSDDRLPHADEIITLPIYLYGDDSNFDIQKTYSGIIENDQFGFFSNSFIVEFGLEDAILSDVIYAKELSYRNSEYRIVTIQKKDGNFRKMAVSGLAKKHIENIFLIYEKCIEKNIPVVEVKKISDLELEIKKCDGKLVANDIFTKIKKMGIGCLDVELDKLWSFYKSISEEKEFTNPYSPEIVQIYRDKTFILKLSLMDGNVSNIMVNKGEYTLFDQEWIVEKELPAEFLMYFSILHIVNVCEISKETFEGIIQKFGLTEEKIDLFLQINTEFYSFHNVIDEKTKERQNMLQKKEQEIRCEIDTFPVCYYDTGIDFNENEKIYGNYVKDKEFFSVEFSLPDNVKKVRIDPALCGERCIQFTKVLLNDVEIQYDMFNVVEYNNKKFLTKRNPYLVFNNPGKKIKFSIDLKKMTELDIEEYLHYLNEIY